MSKEIGTKTKGETYFKYKKYLSVRSFNEGGRGLRPGR